MPSWRYLRGNAGTDASPVVKDRRPGRVNGDRAGRPKAGSRSAAQSGIRPGPERDTVLRQVGQIVRSLEGAVDEGTGHALDPLIKSWTAQWIAAAEADYAGYRVEITGRRGQAQQRLTWAIRTAQGENEELDRIRGDYLACCNLLTSERADQAGAEEPGPGWSAPHLLSGRSMTGQFITALIALAGAFTVTVAFRYTLALALPQQSGTLAWLISAGATSIALAAAASTGISHAIRRRSAHRGSVLTGALAAASWIGLGLAAVLVPLLGTGAHHTPQAALFSGVVYFSSGAWTIFETDRLHNPGYSAYVRLGRRHRLQEGKATAAEAAVTQADAAVEHLRLELDHADQLRQSAIAERQALGAEAANFARVLMAAMLKNPAQTALTETGPDSPAANALSERTGIP